jgi:hypothetical protein
MNTLLKMRCLFFILLIITKNKYGEKNSSCIYMEKKVLVVYRVRSMNLIKILSIKDIPNLPGKIRFIHSF